MWVVPAQLLSDPGIPSSLSWVVSQRHGTYSKWCTGTGWSQLLDVQCVYLCPLPWALMSSWQVDIARERVFTLQKLANAAYQGFSPFREAGCYFLIQHLIYCLTKHIVHSLMDPYNASLCCPSLPPVGIPPFGLSLTLGITYTASKPPRTS